VCVRVVALSLLLGGWTSCSAEAPASTTGTPALCQGAPGAWSFATTWTTWLHADPLRIDERRQSLRYFVRCALGPEETVTLPDGEALRGTFGLVPEWTLRPLDRDGQEIVSACLIALTNAEGAHVQVGLAGPALGDRSLAPELSFMEATFYGNIFADPPIIRGCTGTREAAAKHVVGLAERRCGEPGNPCGVQVEGPCDAGDEPPCRRWSGPPAHRYCVEAHGGAVTFHHPITVYLEVRDG